MKRTEAETDFMMRAKRGKFREKMLWIDGPGRALFILWVLRSDCSELRPPRADGEQMLCKFVLS